MSTKEKQSLALYFFLAFGLAWLCQVYGSLLLLQDGNAAVYRALLSVSMFCPLVAVLAAKRIVLHQPTGIGWKVRGKRRYWLAAWFGPAAFTVLAALLYFAVFSSRLDLSGLYQDLLILFLQPYPANIQGHGSCKITYGFLMRPLFQDLSDSKQEHDGACSTKVLT